MAISTYSAVSAQLPHIYEGVLDYAQEAFFMDTIVTVHTDSDDMRPRGFSVNPSSGTVFNGLAETTDYPAQGYDYTALGTITPKEVGYRLDIGDRRLATDGALSIDAMSEITQEIVYKVPRQAEIDLINHFSSFTGGTVWAGATVNTAGTLLWGNIFAARARLEDAKIPGPYFAVVNSIAYMRLANVANLAGISNAAPLTIRNTIQSQYKIVQVDASLFLYTSPNLATNTVAQYFGGVFAQDAIHYDLRRGLRFEPQRDASARLTEVVATLWYGTGLIRPERGIAIRGTVEANVNN